MTCAKFRCDSVAKTVNTWILVKFSKPDVCLYTRTSSFSWTCNTGLHVDWHVNHMASINMHHQSSCPHHVWLSLTKIYDNPHLKSTRIPSCVFDNQHTNINWISWNRFHEFHKHLFSHDNSRGFNGFVWTKKQSEICIFFKQYLASPFFKHIENMFVWTCFSCVYKCKWINVVWKCWHRLNTTNGCTAGVIPHNWRTVYTIQCSYGFYLNF